MSCVHVHPTGQTSLEYFAKFDRLTKAGIRCWMCHIDALEALLLRERPFAVAEGRKTWVADLDILTERNTGGEHGN
jgi:hypothetical protein